MEEVKEQQVEQTQEEPKVEEKEQPRELTDDEKYAKIQTEKLLKRKKTRRIATFCGMCVALVIALVLIILAAVPVSLNPKCLSGDYWRVYLHRGSDYSVLSENDEKTSQKFAQFTGIYNDAFKQTYLTAIFSGSLFNYQIEEGKEEASSVVGSGGSLVGSGKYFVELNYSSDKTLTTQNGKAYTSRYWANATTEWDGTLKFTKVYIVLNEDSGVSDTTIYIVSSVPSSSASSGMRDVLVKITVRADTSKIFKAWDSLTEE